MRKLFRWLLLAAFSAGLCVGLEQRSRTAFGLIGFLVSFLGLLCGLLAAPVEIRHGASPDLHETVVVETFEDLTLVEAAALVGVLHEYRIAPAVDASTRGDSLELYAAAELVSRVSGFRGERLRSIYRDQWRDLRRTTAPRLIASLRGHRLVERVFPYSEGD